MDPSPKKPAKGSQASAASDVEYRGSPTSESESESADATPDSPLFPGVSIPSVSMTTFQVPVAPLQPPPRLSNDQQFGVSAVPVQPAAPSQAQILEAQRKELEKMRRRSEQAKARRLRKQQEKVAQERAAMERAIQERTNIMQLHVPQTGFTAYPNGRALPSAVVPTQHSTYAFGGSTTRHAPILPASQISRNNPQERTLQPPPCPLCSGPHEPGQCPALNDLPSLYFLREQIQNEPGIETLEERVSGIIPAMACPDDHLSETPCKRLTTLSPRPRHGSELLRPSHMYPRQLIPLVYSQALPHLPDYLLPACLREYYGHPCPGHLLQPNARLKASHQTNEPANALNTIPFRRRKLRRMQTVHTP